MKHSYVLNCDCTRCTKERARRSTQARDNARVGLPRQMKRREGRAIRLTERRPIVGSQEWAETRGDDLGESEDC